MGMPPPFIFPDLQEYQEASVCNLHLTKTVVDNEFHKCHMCSPRVWRNPGALFGSVASYGIGIIGSGIWIHGIWKDAVDPYKTWTIFKIMHSWTKILVSLCFHNCMYVCTSAYYIHNMYIYVYLDIIVLEQLICIELPNSNFDVDLLTCQHCSWIRSIANWIQHELWHLLCEKSP